MVESSSPLREPLLTTDQRSETPMAQPSRIDHFLAKCTSKLAEIETTKTWKYRSLVSVIGLLIYPILAFQKSQQLDKLAYLSQTINRLKNDPNLSDSSKAKLIEKQAAIDTVIDRALSGYHIGRKKRWVYGWAENRLIKDLKKEAKQQIPLSEVPYQQLSRSEEERNLRYLLMGDDVDLCDKTE